MQTKQRNENTGEKRALEIERVYKQNLTTESGPKILTRICPQIAWSDGQKNDWWPTEISASWELGEVWSWVKIH
jgi:hypothetical protein